MSAAASQTKPLAELHDLRSKLRDSNYLQLLVSSSAKDSISLSDPVLIAAAQLASSPAVGVPVSEKLKRKGTTYHNVFTGRLLVDWIYENLHLSTRAAAVSLATHLFAAKLVDFVAVAPAFMSLTSTNLKAALAVSSGASTSSSEQQTQQSAQQTSAQSQSSPSSQTNTSYAAEFDDSTDHLYRFNQAQIAQQFAELHVADWLSSPKHHAHHQHHVSSSSSSSSSSVSAASQQQHHVGLNERDWKVILAGASSVSFVKGAFLLTEGKPNKMLYRIKSGQIRVVVSAANKTASSSAPATSASVTTTSATPTQAHTTIVVLGPDAMIGELSALSPNEISPASAIVESDKLECFAIDLRTLRHMLHLEPGLAQRFWRVVALRLATRLRGVQTTPPPPPSVISPRDHSHSSTDASKEAAQSKTQVTESAEDADALRAFQATFNTDHLKHSTGSAAAAAAAAASSSSASSSTSPSTPIAAVSPSPSLSSTSTSEQADAQFRNRFHLTHTSEVLLKTIPHCALIRSPISVRGGSMYCSANYVCFYGKIFGVAKRKSLSLREVYQVLAPLSTTTIPTENTLSATQLAITSIRKTYLFEFSVAAEASEAYSLVHSCWQAKLKTTSALKERPTKEKEDNEKQTQQPASSHEQQQQQQQSAHHKEGEKAGGDHQHPHHHHTHVQHRVLTKDDWVLLRSGFSSVQSTSVKQNEVVIAEGKPNYRLFQVAAGRCRIETKNKIVGYADEGDILGEVSFLEGGSGASASVFVHSDKAELYIIDGEFLDLVFVRDPGLAGRFYHHLAIVVAERLSRRRPDFSSSWSLTNSATQQ